jgi:hypothetical protein
MPAKVGSEAGGIGVTFDRISRETPSDDVRKPDADRPVEPMEWRSVVPPP